MKNDSQSRREQFGKHQEGTRLNPVKSGSSHFSQVVPTFKNRFNANNCRGFPKFPTFPPQYSRFANANDEREAYEERAAIMEFDGGLDRHEAERLAYEIVFGGKDKRRSKI